jgi:NitT/TauT family transport system permease protein
MNASARSDASLRVLLPACVAVVVLGAWQGVTRLAAIPEVLLPPPSSIIARLIDAAPEIAHHALVSGWDATLAFLLAAVAGIAIALVMSSSTMLREALYPNLILFQVIPKIALAPLFVIWMGLGSSSRITFSVFVSLFPVAIACFEGFSRADRHILMLCRAICASPTQTFFAVRVPFALPYLFSGLKVACTMAVIGIVVGEFVTARAGIGYFILHANSRADTAGIFAALIGLCVMGFALYGAVVAAEAAARRWWRG